MNIDLRISAEGFDDQAIQDLTYDLQNTINRETNYYQASLAQSESAVGTKGDPITIGTIVLAVLGTGGGAAALIGVFKSFVERSRELSIKLKKKDGDEMEITSKNIHSDEIKSMIENFAK